MKVKQKIVAIFLIVIICITNCAFAITEEDNGNMKIYTTSGGLEFEGIVGFDIQGYVTTNKSTGEKTLISSTFSNDGYHTFLNVNGKNGEMNGTITYENSEQLNAKLLAMQYTAYDSNNEWQNIDGIDLKIDAQFINEGEQLQIVYTLKNTTTTTLTYSLATTADVQIDEDDSATIDRLEDGSGVRLWTKEGDTEQPVQFVFYGKNVPGTTNVDNLWIGSWGNEYMENMFNNNPEITKVEDRDSAFTYSWVNRSIDAGETKTYSVLMEVGEINVPNTSLTLEDNTKYYYTDVIINGTITDKDLKDNIIVHYVVDGTEYTLPALSTTGTAKEFSLDLTSLNLTPGQEHTLKVWATDSTDCDSNVEEKTFLVTYLKKPELLISKEEWTNEDVTFKITDTVNEEQYVDKYQYRINHGSWVECAKDTDIPIQENGIIQIDARIVGTQANDYSNIITKTAKIDKINPTTTIPTATKTTSTITVNFAQTDAHSGIDTTKTMYAIKKGDSWSEWQESNVFTGLTHNTEYKVKTKATDIAGNTSESEELVVKTDELLLGNLILKLNNRDGADYTENTWTNQNIYIAIQENTVGATTTYKATENSAQAITETNQETTVTTNGVTILVLSVTDGTNIVTSDAEYILKVDKIAPVINQLSLDKEDWGREGKVITGKAIDVLSGIESYQFSKQDNITATSEGWNSITITNSEITQTAEINENDKYYFYVKDAAGNIGTVGIDTKIDSLGPIITFTKTDGKTIINVTDTGAGVKNTFYAWTTENVEPAQTDWKTYSEAVTYTGTSKNKLYLWAKADDNVGNETISSTSYAKIVAPVIETSDKFTNEYASFKLNSDNEEEVIYQFKINDGEWQNISVDSLHTVTNIDEGDIEISARVLDNAGRYSEVTTKTVTVQRVEEIPDGTKPDGTITDGSIADGQLPDTGINKLILIIFIFLIVVAIVAYRKNKSYKEI